MGAYYLKDNFYILFLSFVVIYLIIKEKKNLDGCLIGCFLNGLIRRDGRYEDVGGRKNRQRRFYGYD
ncbi:hypothetical protein CH563_05420 [Haemophilus influenzae]|nr:hypothetical protein CH582_07540 [Haemophilus influenzae]AXP66956.1 hypothetical protein CH576_07560 [Haemophilus influenzae]AYO35028.1 hypothetical protein CH563_05420 [Haemophilus influenzae]RFN64530.1 hypothetical protein CH594_04940 [Haemophilus influenzae]RFO15112.1 hypothetical protein CH581_05965 [Haemophilus influenzae]